MSVKWSKKEAIQCLQELRNPFDKTNGQKPALTNANEKIKAIGEKIRSLGRRKIQ